MFKYLAAVSLLFPTFSLAQSTAMGDLIAKDVAGRWALGVGASLSDSPYVGEDIRVRPFPWITYEGERIFWRGLGGGVHAFKGDNVEVDFLVSGRFDGFDIDDLDARGLAGNGLNAGLLEDRDDGADLGLSVSWEGRAGEIKLRALADVTDTSGGYEFAADYSYPLHLGKTVVVPGIGVRWMSDDLVNYYYGTLDEEIARGVPLYQPGAALVPQVSVGFMRALGKKWSLFGSVDYKFLPDEIADSPLLERDVSGTLGLKVGINRRF
ncbi:MAG: MipA/OmpV family protein [Steroidobacteraceae bacterium]